MFYFQQLLQQGLDGIDRTAMIPSVVGIAYSILLVGFLIGLYQAAMRAGDVQALAVTGIKYLAIAVILANWSTVFHEVNDSFNQIAQFIDSSSGAGDMFLSWFDQLKDQFSNNGIAAILPSISASFAAIATALMVLLAYLIYALAVVVFAFFYVLYGCVLYVLGPLVLALLPISGIGQLAKGYATNLMIWNAWGILYATFGALITALQFSRVDQVMNQGFFGGFFQGTSDSLILGLISILYALALILIPFVAKRLISGDVGSSAYSLVRAGAAAAGTLMSGVSGVAEGLALGSGTGAALATSGATTGVASAGAIASCSAPRPQPSLAQTIRSGIMSAVNGAAPPAPCATQDTADTATAATAVAGSSQAGAAPQNRFRSAAVFRPVGITQTFAFHAGRFAAGVAMESGNGGNGHKGNA
ncbi:MAG TPA: hypothetical protein VJT08_05880 [Terriglobales bacterium]|nr:hypothetical protein [Terriglobales bacterium]